MVLVTGGTGLVGSHLLLRLCEDGELIRAIFRSHNGLEKTKNLFKLYGKGELFSNIEWQQADINQIPELASTFSNISEVYHCAALISFDPNDEESLRKTNIEGTANVVNLCLDFEVKKLCYLSSVAALGDLKPNETVVNESSEWNPEKPHSDYAISKYGAEMEIWRGQQEGLDVVIVNPGIILGPGFWERGSGRIFAFVKNGLKYYTKGITGYVDVKDVVDIMTRLMKSDIKNDRFILVSENISYEAVLNEISGAFGISVPGRYASPFMTSTAWKCDWLIHFLTDRKRTISKDAARSLHSKIFYSNEKIKSRLDISFISMKSSIREAVRVNAGK
ncbi:MAG TPA: NAD-dependent epimerase/dehydratase family protein [Flavobacterium sp.]|jgi:nucleoside-diphosphate-sugar epimerase